MRWGRGGEIRNREHVERRARDREQCYAILLIYLGSQSPSLLFKSGLMDEAYSLTFPLKVHTADETVKIHQGLSKQGDTDHYLPSKVLLSGYTNLPDPCFTLLRYVPS